MPLLSEGAGKNRATCVGSWRKVAKAIAALQGAVSDEKRARQQLAVAIGDSAKLVRNSTASGTRTRRAQGQALTKSVTPAAELQHRDTRADSLENQGGQGGKDLQERQHWNARADSPAASCHQVCFLAASGLLSSASSTRAPSSLASVAWITLNTGLSL